MKNVISNELNGEELVSKSKIQASSDSDQSETEEASTKEIIMYKNKNLLKIISESLYSIIEEGNKSKKIQKDHSPFAHEHAPKISIFIINRKICFSFIIHKFIISLINFV